MSNLLEARELNAFYGSIQVLFGRANDVPLGSAVSLVMMLVVTLIVCLFLWAVGYRKMQLRAAS